MDEEFKPPARTVNDEGDLSEHAPDESVEFGFREDGLLWVTVGRDTPTADAAERDGGRGWRVVGTGYIRATGDMVNTKDEEWEVCDRDAPGARFAWRLVQTNQKTIWDLQIEESAENPYYLEGSDDETS